MPSEQAKRLWTAIETKRLSMEDKQTRRIQDGLIDAVQPVKQRLKEQGAQDAIDDIESEINKKAIEDAYKDLYSSVGVSFAMDTFEGLISRKQEHDTLEDIWMQRLQEFAATEAGSRIVNVTDYTVEQVREVLQEGIQEGYGIEKIARELDKSPAINRVRARRIARTEIVSASNEGSMMGARSTSLNLKKVWISTPDNRTRTFAEDGWGHLSADGEEVAMDEMFTRTGEPLRYPGDPNGSAGNVIQCRCAVAHKTYD